MPQPQSITSSLNTAPLGQQQYLNPQEKSVNIRQAIAKQEQEKASGLNGIEIRTREQALGKDDFLKLLVTQLSYQDPTAPVKDQQFIAQMAQFSSLEQMQNMASSLGRLADRQAHSLIGRYVIGRDFVSGNETAGIARALFYDEGGQAFLKVGSRAVSVDDLQMVGNPQSIQKKYGGLAATEIQKKTLQKEIGQNEIITSKKDTKKLEQKNDLTEKNINIKNEKQKNDARVTPSENNNK